MHHNLQVRLDHCRESLDGAGFRTLGAWAMAIDKMVAPLLRVPLFAGLKPLQLTEIARQAERIGFRAGGIITKAGTPGDGAYLIVAGPAMRLAGAASPQPPEAVEPGSLIGELAMLTEHAYGATVVAEGRVHALKITRAALHEQMRADPALADHFTGLLAARLAQVAAEMQRIDQMLSGIAANTAQPAGAPPSEAEPTGQAAQRRLAG